MVSLEVLVGRDTKLPASIFATLRGRKEFHSLYGFRLAVLQAAAGAKDRESSEFWLMFWLSWMGNPQHLSLNISRAFQESSLAATRGGGNSGGIEWISKRCDMKSKLATVSPKTITQVRSSSVSMFERNASCLSWISQPVCRTH